MDRLNPHAKVLRANATKAIKENTAKKSKKI
jgi:hypothetical protein